jgi:hypothetical protein
MRQILFNNSTTVPGATAFGSLAAGRVYAFDANNMGTSLPLDEATNAKEVIFVQGGVNGKHIFSAPIKVADVKSVKGTTYSAPTAQATTLTPNFTSTVPAGEGTIRVVRVDAGFKPHERVTATVKFTGKTRQQIVDAFVALINKQYPRFVTASRGSSADSSTLILTGDLRVSFETSKEDLAAGFTLSVVAPSFGTGTAADVAEMEEIAWGANVLNRIYLAVFPERYAQNANYDLHQFEFKTSTTPNISKANEYGEITIAVTTTGAPLNLPKFFGLNRIADLEDVVSDLD